MTHPDDVISQTLREEIGGGDPAEPQHGEIEGSHSKTDQGDLLSHVDLPAVDQGREGGKEVREDFGRLLPPAACTGASWISDW